MSGQTIRIEAEPGIINTIILHENHYLISRKNGSVFVGSTTEVTKRCAALSYRQIINHWAGMPPYSADSIPSICESPRSRMFALMSDIFTMERYQLPASTKLLAELMTNGKHSNADPFQFDRH